jgi:hypothetical protein
MAIDIGVDGTFGELMVAQMLPSRRYTSLPGDQSTDMVCHTEKSPLSSRWIIELFAP